jgi:hypothetical protein
MLAGIGDAQHLVLMPAHAPAAPGEPCGDFRR